MRRCARGPVGEAARGGKTLALAAAMATLAACGGSVTDARYPPREDGCPVRRYPGPPAIPVDELGAVKVECGSEGGTGCERQLENAVCRRGGDVAWGVADNALDATTRVAHAAHSRRATQGPRERGCALQIDLGAPPPRIENIGAVTALCGEDDSVEVCTRQLADEACLLGADVLWQVEGPTPEPTENGMKQRMHGRAAHTR
jgi:hypothetical protein